MIPRRSYTVPLPHREPRCNLARVPWSWASSTSPPIPSPTAACTSTCRARRRGGRAHGGGRRGHHRHRRRIDAPGRRAAAARQEELRRVLPVVERLAPRVQVPISIDTYKARVAREALERGATIINDISGLLYDPGLGAVAAASGAALILMHTRGRSSGMYDLAVYEDPAQDVARELGEAIERAIARGRVARRDHRRSRPRDSPSGRNTATTCWRGSTRWPPLDRPILSGPSRKSFLKAALGEREPSGARVGNGRGGRRERLLRRAHRPRSRRARRWSTSSACRTVFARRLRRIRARGSQGDPRGSTSLYSTPCLAIRRLTRRTSAAKTSANRRRASRAEDGSAVALVMAVSARPYRPKAHRRLLMGHMDHDRPDDSNAPRHNRVRSPKKRPPRVSASRARSRTPPVR